MMNVEKSHDPNSAGALAIAGRRRLLDWCGQGAALLGGLLVIGAVAVMLLFMLRQAAPLALPARFGPAVSLPLEEAGVEAQAGAVLLAGIDEYRQTAYLLDRDGGLHVLDMALGRVVDRIDPLGLAPGERVTAAASGPDRGRLAVGTSGGRLIPLSIEFAVDYQSGARRVRLSASAGSPLIVDEEGRALTQAALADGRAGRVASAITEDGRVLVLAQVRERGMLGGGAIQERRHDLTDAVAGRPTALALSPDGGTLLVGSEGGLLYQWDLANPEAPRFVAAAVAAGPEAGGLAGAGERGAAAVLALRYLLGGESVAVGDALGGVSVWFNVRDEALGGGRRLQRVHVLEHHGAPVVHIAPSQRSRTFLTADAAGVVKMHHATSARTFFSAPADAEPITDLLLAPKADAQVILTPTRLVTAPVHNPHPEVSWRTLFGRVHYEGYDEPRWMWQSSGGSSAFEPKLSLTPLIYGTLKGAFYSLLFSLPVGLLGAVYVSQFMHPRLRAVVKPVMEMMAGLPSVVLGFLAGLWLAPLIARHLAGIAAMLVLLPASALTAGWAARRVAARLGRALPSGWESLMLLPVLALGMWLSLHLGAWAESALAGGDVRLWLYERFGITYDVRNSIVIGIAMGFAVVPVVFTIAEDALACVPPELAAGSLALGATRWQTAMRVVVPAALPGMLSAVMIGTGRAVGETMIVLMATGNTPVMDPSPFTGFRSLAANVAVEMPEAPAGGTLYRVLFLSALLLFGFTFLLNTAGEVVRMRMRRRVARL